MNKPFPTELFDYIPALDSYVQEFDNIDLARSWAEAMRSLHDDVEFEQRNNRVLIYLAPENVCTY